MSNLNISLHIPKPEILLGESLMVEVTLENSGGDAVEVPSPDSDREFEYALRRIDPDPAPPVIVSAKKARRQKTVETVPDLPRFLAKLNPQQKLVYPEDLSTYLIPAPPVGHYEITAAYDTGMQTLTSSAASVDIVAPRVADLAAVTTANWNKLASVFVHQNQDGTWAVFQRESSPDRFQEGVQYRRIDLPQSSTAPMVATAIELDFDPSGRWFAWLEQTGLGAGVAQEATLFARIPPTAVALKNPRLYPIGWQPSGESAVFLVLGTDPRGRVALTAITFEAAGTAAASTVVLAAAKPPTHWAARLAGMDPDPVFDVIWAETGPGRTWLFRQNVTPKTGQVGAVQALCEHSEALAAISLYPLKGSTPDVVDLIYGPSKEATPFNFLRLPLTGGNPVLDIDIPQPQKDSPILPRAWALAAKPLENPVALALLDNKLMLVRMAPQPQWQVLNQETRQAGHLHLEVVGEDNLWAIWADTRLGIQYQLTR